MPKHIKAPRRSTPPAGKNQSSLQLSPSLLARLSFLCLLSAVLMVAVFLASSFVLKLSGQGTPVQFLLTSFIIMALLAVSLLFLLPFSSKGKTNSK